MALVAAICIILVACNVPRACPMSACVCVCVRVVTSLSRERLVVAVPPIINFLTTLTCRQRQLDIFYGLCAALLSFRFSLPLSYILLIFDVLFAMFQFSSARACRNAMSPCDAVTDRETDRQRDRRSLSFGRLAQHLLRLPWHASGRHPWQTNKALSVACVMHGRRTRQQYTMQRPANTNICMKYQVNLVFLHKLY